MQLTWQRIPSLPIWLVFDPLYERTGGFSGKNSLYASFNAGMFLFGSATVICTLSTLDIDEPAPSRIPFMVVKTLLI